MIFSRGEVLRRPGVDDPRWRHRRRPRLRGDRGLGRAAEKPVIGRQGMRRPLVASREALDYLDDLVTAVALEPAEHDQLADAPATVIPGPVGSREALRP